MKLGLLISLMAGLVACKSDGGGPHVAGSAPPAGSASGAHGALGHQLFWKVEKDGKTTYVLGTMHVGVDPDALPPIVWKSLDQARVFAMETDLGKAASLDVMRHDGSTLHRELGDAYWAKLEGALGKDAAARVDGMKVMIPATLLSMRGLPETQAMDGALLARAQAEKKPIVFLEPIEAEEAVLDKWMDAKMLEAMLDDLPGEEQHARDMLAAYIAGDEAKIEALSDAERADWKRAGKSDADYDAQMEDLLFSRNASWVPELEELHGSGGGFVAVGAMHLIGKRSVLDLLRQRGYTVTRLTP
ncbi:MAG: TraB/GumN family protein [Deltaproteobacteria bacterium]|nr:TraB/GumN family protein [Deltaproteobacteria bacterium]